MVCRADDFLKTQRRMRKSAAMGCESNLNRAVENMDSREGCPYGLKIKFTLCRVRFFADAQNDNFVQPCTCFVFTREHLPPSCLSAATHRIFAVVVSSKM